VHFSWRLALAFNAQVTRPDIFSEDAIILFARDLDPSNDRFASGVMGDN
jgi:hypothetical protein